MKKNKNRKEQRLNNGRPKQLHKFERMFLANKYAGKGSRFLNMENGKSAVAVIAPHAVNFCEDGQKTADRFSGGLVRLLAYETGCSAIYTMKEYTQNQVPDIVVGISEYLKHNKIQVLLDLQTTDSIGDSIVEISSIVDKENVDKLSFVKKAVQYSFEYEYRDSGIEKIVLEVTANSEGIAARSVNLVQSVQSVSKQPIAYVRLRVNKKYCDPTDKDKFIGLYNTLLKILCMLSNLDWGAEKIRAYRLWQSSQHKPQDKIEILFSHKSERAFLKNSLLNICSYGSGLEKVRLHEPGAKTVGDLPNTSGEVCKEEYVFLTNRLIELLFGREWVEGKEEEAGLRGAPVIVYENEKEVYPIGLPKANQIEGVFFSSALYEEKKPEAALFDYVIFNRYTDSRLHIDFDKADYADFGRVKDKDGLQAKKVMIPRYYKRLLGFLDSPFKMIRSEEYDNIVEQLSSEESKAFEDCYEPIKGDNYYQLKKKFDQSEDEEDSNTSYSEDEAKSIELVKNVQKKLNLNNNVEILRIPKEVRPKQRLRTRIMRKIDKFKIWILKKTIGKAEYLLKAEWTSETDDKNNIARVSPNMMSLLGVSENDKILVKFGKKQLVLRVLVNEKLTDYQIGIPAPARKVLGMNSINDIVIVHRDMIHIFWRHSEEQTIAILGTVLAVFQVITQTWMGVVLCLICIPLIMYFVLNEERVKVR